MQSTKVPISKGAQGVTGLEDKKFVSDNVMEATACEEGDDNDENSDDESDSEEEGRESCQKCRPLMALILYFVQGLPRKDISFCEGVVFRYLPLYCTQGMF